MDTVIQGFLDYMNTPLDNGTMLAYIIGISFMRGFSKNGW
jgi:hypothetical protein